MYEKHFGLSHKPFAITPDPRYLYLSARHREALAHLLYGVGEGGGFVQLTGEVGTGKTTLCRSLLEQLPPEVDLALILNPRLDAVELVAAVCDELGAPYPAGSNSLKVLVSALNDHLLQSHAAGRRTVLVIDEAQNLSPEVLEQVRLLTNLETAETKLLEIILIGQPELRDLLERPELRQLAQRITARYHLDPLSPAETMAYVRHRLRVAGVSRSLFSKSALKTLARLSGGVPRLINVICDRALLGAYVEEKAEVDERIIRRAAREVRAERNLPERWRRSLTAPTVRRNLLLLILLIVLIPAALQFYQALPERDVTAASPDLAAVPNNAVAPGEPEGETTAATLAEQLAALPDDSEAAAWHDLFQLWGHDFQPGLDPCAQARDLGLRCLEETGNLTVLRRLNRPALLRLYPPGGTSRTVLLAELAEREAVLILAGTELHLPASAIEQFWYGGFQILWPPPVAAQLLREGDRGPEVQRLRDALDRLTDEGEMAAEAGLEPPPVAQADLFDSELRRRVMTFQAAHGLQPDGIVGPMTLLRLSEALVDPATPRLVPAAGND
jgi:general secretion pathway protein A